MRLDNRTHPLLQQLPLTVSPFVNLPTATTLPYTYKPMPSTLPPSSIGMTAATAASSSSMPSGPDGAKPKYVVSASGHAAHPDDILAACRELNAHLARLQAEAEAEIAAVDERIRAHKLAEQRRLAPGWLDSDARLLQPERLQPAAGPPGVAAAAGGQGGAGLELESAATCAAAEQTDGTQQYGGVAGLQWASNSGSGDGGRDGGNGYGPGGASEMAVPDEGRAQDSFFKGLAIRPKQ